MPAQRFTGISADQTDLENRPRQLTGVLVKERRQFAIMQKTLLVTGLLIVLAGVLWPWLGKLPFGRLPGDIMIDKPGFKLFFPITSMLLVSGLISLILWLFKK